MPNSRKHDPWLSLPAAAKALRRHRQTVAKMAAEGQLKHDTVAGRMVIDRESVLAKRKELDKEERQADRLAAG